MGEATQHDGAADTIRICNLLSEPRDGVSRAARMPRARLLAIAQAAVDEHGDRLGVLLAVARLYLAAGENVRALKVLVKATPLGAHEPVTYRLLGEALFRCGDPARAERMLERAIAGGLTDPETLAWRGRARMCAARQPKAVTLPPEPTTPQRALVDPRRDETTRLDVQRPRRRLDSVSAF